MTIRMWKFRIYPASIIVVSLSCSIFSPVRAAEEPYRQTFVVTAYYSPLPGQSAYARGSYEDDLLFNGEGVRGADGTPVYAGMIAAPPSYPFGSVIALDGVGVGTVHDRGGRIVEWGSDLHRIDLWMGSGEEGLARALTWGVRTVQGTVYPRGAPSAPADAMPLSSFAADFTHLASLPAVNPVDRLMGLREGDRGSRVRLLQDSLREAGFFSQASTGEFGPVTRASLRSFLASAGIEDSGEVVDERTAAMLVLWPSIGPRNLPDVPSGLVKGTIGADVRQIQKILRYLGYYRGRTDGTFGDRLHDAVVAFQRARGIIDDDAPSAGRVGPATRRELLRAWQSKVILVKADQLVLKRSVTANVVAEHVPTRVMVMGARGADVRKLQRLLVRMGYLPPEDVTGTFAARTEAALLSYQLDRSIVTTPSSHGAGVYGPATRSSLRGALADDIWRQVRARGVTQI